MSRDWEAAAAATLLVYGYKVLGFDEVESNDDSVVRAMKLNWK